jgi:hypothetical protein
MQFTAETLARIHLKLQVRISKKMRLTRHFATSGGFPILDKEKKNTFIKASFLSLFPFGGK